MKYLKNPSCFFILYTAIVGLLYLFLTPPFQVADEQNHFFRAWQVSTGQFSAISHDNRLGGYVPKSFIELSYRYRPYALNSYNRIERGTLKEARHIRLNAENQVFYDFTNTALYSAFMYLPQGLGIGLGRMLRFEVLGVLYLGRLFNLLLFMLLGYKAMQLIPIKKWLFLVLITLPMTLAIQSSNSADVILHALSFLFLAFVLKLIYAGGEKYISYKQVVLMLLFATGFALSKLVYLPLIFLLFLVPVTKFSSYKSKYLIIGLVLLVGFATAFFFKKGIDNRYIPYHNYNQEYRFQTMLKKGVDVEKQIRFVLENPLFVTKAFVSSFTDQFRLMTNSYIGRLGYFDIALPPWLVYLNYLVILLLSGLYVKSDKNIRLTFFHRLGFVLLPVVITFLIALSQYLSWVEVGDDRVYPFQGRYFIPVLPLFFLAISNLIRHRPKGVWQARTIALFICMLNGIVSLYAIVNTSYTRSRYVESCFTCSYAFGNDSTTSAYTYFIEKMDTVASFKQASTLQLSTKELLTGNYSLVLTKKSPYGFTVRYKGAQKGDKIIVTCRAKGGAGYLVVSEYPSGFYHSGNKVYFQNDTLGWKLRKLECIIPHAIPDTNELRIFMYSTSDDTTYFDDWKVTVFHAK